MTDSAHMSGHQRILRAENTNKLLVKAMRRENQASKAMLELLEMIEEAEKEFFFPPEIVKKLPAVRGHLTARIGELDRAEREMEKDYNNA